MASWRRRRSSGKDPVVQRLGSLVVLGALGWAAVERDLSMPWIVLGLLAALIALAMMIAPGRLATRQKARPQRPPVPPWAFPASLVAVVTLCFGVALFLPEIRSLLMSTADPPRPKERAHVRLSASSLPRFDCQVAYVNDGDTLRCTDGVRVRLHAVAARERDGTCSPGHPCPSASATAARDALQRLAGGRRLTCLQTGVSYNRKAAICWTPDGEEINCAMVRSGTALRWERFDRKVRICRR